MIENDLSEYFIIWFVIWDRVAMENWLIKEFYVQIHLSKLVYSDSSLDKLLEQ